MNSNYTLTIIKPNAMKKNVIGEIITIFEKNNFQIAGIKSIQLTETQAKSFYEIHKERPFYQDLCNFMVSTPVVVMVLKGHNAVENVRRIMGATDPQKAEPDTIRKKFGDSLQENAIHGSDSIENAIREIKFFFSESELVSLGIYI